ncbi:MAG: DNA recombination protein RmuC, partial [Firmicutes bacterium]|nr:DNA recombination protein RmuC [Bacillota bacterium]
LRKLMTNVKSRGVIGELQLGSILEQILAPGQYETNAQVKPNTQERVEYAVKMPGNGGGTVYLPIDSKFPGDIYGALQDAYDNADAVYAETQRKRLAQFIKLSAKEIRDKYVEPPYTTDFAVMFLPFEGLYAEVVNMELMEICQRDYKIMIAGPSTLAALLNSLQMGFRTLAIQKRSTEVWGVLGQVKGEFDKFADVLTSAQQRINQANAELDKLIGVRTRSIQKTLSGMQKLSDPDEEEQGRWLP